MPNAPHQRGPNAPRCGRKCRLCRDCRRRFSREEHELTHCPECGCSRVCTQFVDKPGDPCRFHGGRLKNPRKNKNYLAGELKKTRYGESLPKKFLDHYITAETDPNLLSLRPEVAIVQAYVFKLIDRLHSKESDAVWELLSTKWADFNAAHAAGEAAEAAEALSAIGRLITKGLGQAQQIRELMKQIDHKAALSRAEIARQKDLQTMISAEQAMALVQGVSIAVAECVVDPAVRRAIGDRFAKLLTFGGGASGLAGFSPPQALTLSPAAADISPSIDKPAAAGEVPVENPDSNSSEERAI